LIVPEKYEFIKCIKYKMKTESFNLSKNTITLLEKNGIITATPIQKKIIPAVLAGRDVLAQSETGSGKTISFAIPILEQIQATDGLCALVLVPTRELCNQVTDEFIKYSQGKRLSITAVYGGVSMENQIRKIRKTNVIIATPGRLIDLIDRNVIHLDKIKYLVFDEADRMLDMGFIRDIEIILKHMTQKLQTMLFSATVSKEITVLSKKYLYNPVHVILESSVDPGFLKQTYYQTTNDQKISLLMHLLKQERDLTLVFCNRKHITAKLADKLTRYGITAKCLHGDLTQGQRERVTSDFRNKRFNILIATDVASRGLHIEDITHVYNYEIPKDVDSYTHRVGRTARAGKKGEAISLVTNGEEQKFFKQILFNYRGSITLKRVDPSVLPETESLSSGNRRSKERFQNRDDKQFRRNDKPKFGRDDRKDSFRKNDRPKFRSENEPDSFRKDDRKKFRREDRTDSYRKNEKPKFKGADSIGAFRKTEGFKFRNDEASGQSDINKKPKTRSGGNTRSFRKKERFISKGEENTGQFRNDKKKSFADNKPKIWTKEKPGNIRKRKSDSWDETISLNRDDRHGRIHEKNKPGSSEDNVHEKKRIGITGFFARKKSKSMEDKKPKFWSIGKPKKKYGNKH
jgi:ATP-dependent RNA helicase DeaD